MNTATTFATPPMLLDVDVPRVASAAHNGIALLPLVKPAACAVLAAQADESRPATAESIWPQQHLHPLWRQLHWELCSSLLMRPLAKLLGLPILLPDTFLTSSGIGRGAAVDSRVELHRMPMRLRLDVVLLSADAACLSWQGETMALANGIAVLSDVQIAQPVFSGDCVIWTTCYFSPVTVIPTDLSVETAPSATGETR